MSGETLAVGSLIFRDGTPEKAKFQALEELASALEVELSDIRYDIVSGKWSFQSINWQSHVERDGIETFLEPWKGHIKQFLCSLHYLTDPEEINYREECKTDKVETTEKYWDCECKNDYIHPRTMTVCPVCGAVAEDQPDSRINEVLLRGLPL